MPIYSNALTQRPANMLAYSQDSIGATPRNEYLGALADFLAQSYAPQRTQQMQGVAQFLNVPAVSQTLDRLSYGEPLTTGAGGLGGTTRIRPEALEAAMAVAPTVQPTTMATLQAARAARQAALSAGKAGERYAERVVPQIMERGGLPAQLLQDMSQGTRRQIFVGENSKTWNKGNAAKAMEMEAAGANPEDIWTATGTFRGPEGKLRQEISDAGLAANDYRNTGGAIVLKHPELKKSYEELPVNIKISPQESLVETSAYKAPVDELSRKLGDSGTMYIPAKGQVPLDVYAHELQHAVQAREGFARGGSPDMIRRNFMDYADPQWIEYAKTLPNYKNQPTDKARQEFIESFVKMRLGNPEDVYLRLAGEAEARAVQNRMDMTDAQRQATFPYKSYDVPVNKMIVKTR
jgi:hypothetical protein